MKSLIVMVVALGLMTGCCGDKKENTGQKDMVYHNPDGTVSKAQCLACVFPDHDNMTQTYYDDAEITPETGETKDGFHSGESKSLYVPLIKGFYWEDYAGTTNCAPCREAKKDEEIDTCNSFSKYIELHQKGGVEADDLYTTFGDRKETRPVPAAETKEHHKEQEGY